MPLKLLIMSLLISLTVPVVMGSVESYERATARSALMREAERVVSAVEEVMSSGEGNRRIVSVSLPDSVDRFHLGLEIGGPPEGTASRTVRCTMGAAPFVTLAPESPPARMTADGGALQLDAGDHRLAVECSRLDGRLIAVLEELR
jgi:hypothetical protein